MTYWISDFSYLVLGRVGLVGLVREPKLSTPPYGGGGGGSLLEIHGLKNINNLLTFFLSQTPQNLPQNRESEQSSLPEYKYPYCVSRYNKGAGQQNKETSGHNKETDGEVWAHF